MPRGHRGWAQIFGLGCGLCTCGGGVGGRNAPVWHLALITHRLGGLLQCLLGTAGESRGAPLWPEESVEGGSLRGPQFAEIQAFGGFPFPGRLWRRASLVGGWGLSSGSPFSCRGLWVTCPAGSRPWCIATSQGPTCRRNPRKVSGRPWGGLGRVGGPAREKGAPKNSPLQAEAPSAAPLPPSH